MKTPWLVVGLATCCVLAGCATQASARHSFLGPTRLAHQITAGSDSTRSAELDVISGATIVDISTGDIDGHLYAAATPADSNSAPVATVDGSVVQISLASTNQPGPAEVRIVLSSHVSWRVRLDGGATTESVNLTGVRLTALDFDAGASRIDATLPDPVGTVPITMAGGASSFQLHLPTGVPARVSFAGGAGSANVDGATRSGVAGGTVVDTANWPSSANRYDIDNTAGVSALTLDHAA